jgi:hypothetical protein
MVRLYEIENSLSSPESTTDQLMQMYFPTAPFSYYDINKDGTVDAKEQLELSRRNKIKKLPVIFKSISKGLKVFDNTLESFEGLPDEVKGVLMLASNKFTSLNGMPRYVFDLSIWNNPITSLDGLEKSYATFLRLDWTPDLPLLRCLSHCDSLDLNNEQDQARKASSIINEFNRDLKNKRQDVLNHHMDRVPNTDGWSKEEIEDLKRHHRGIMKKGIYECQYALIKAGLKGNAKW